MVDTNEIDDFLREQDPEDSNDGDAGDDGDAALDEVLEEAEEVVEGDDGDDGDAGDAGEEIPEEAPKKSEPVHNEHNDALAAALAKLQEQESELQRARNEILIAKAEQERPRFIPYDELDDETRGVFDKAAERMGVTPEYLVFHEYQRISEEYRRKVESVQYRFEAELQQAKIDVDQHFQQHPKREKYGSAVAQKLLEMGWDNVDRLAQRDPATFRHTAKVMIDLAFRSVEDDAERQQRAMKAKQAMKASTRSEASRSKAPVTKKSSQSGNDADAFLDFFAESSVSLAERLKKK